MALEERLELDVSAALRGIDTIEDALTNSARAFKVALADALNLLGTVRVDADTSDLTSSISAAVDAADVSATVVADASDVTASIDGAVDAADSDVTITGDASDVTGSIEGAVDAADASVDVVPITDRIAGAISAAIDAADATVTIEADTTQAEQSISGLGSGASGAAGSMTLLGTSIRGAAGAAAAFIGGREILQFFTDATDAASSLAESTSKATEVFGSAVGAVEDFAETADTSVGLAQDQALEFTGTFGNLLTALGLGKQAAADLSPEIVQLGADLASFNNLGVPDTLEKLRSGLVGEIEPLRALGISFDAAQVEAKALELGLADVASEITEGAKVQARWALIMEQSTNAAGDFARTSDGLANQQRILQAEFRNVQIEIGQQLLPSLLDLVQSTRGDLVPALGELGTAAVPLIVSALESLAPLLSAIADLAIALAPAFEGVGSAVGILAPVMRAVADIIAEIPDPLVRLVGTFLLFQRTVGALLPLIARVAPALAASLGPAGAVAAAIGAAAVAFGLLGDSQKDTEDSVRSLTDALADQQAAIDADIDAAGRKAIADKGQEADLRRLGLTTERFIDLAGQGARGYEQFVQALNAGAEAAPGIADNLDQAGEAASAFGEASTEAATASGRALFAQIAGNRDLLSSFKELAQTQQEAAAAAIDRLVVEEQVTEAQVRQSRVVEDGVVNQVATLRNLERLLPVTRELGDATTDAADSNETWNRSFDDLVQGAEDANDALNDYLDSVFDTLGVQQRAVDAERSLEDALRNVQEKERDLTDARRVRTDATRDAIAEERALNAVEDATTGVTEAERLLARAREGRGTNAEALADAEKALAQAQRDVNDATKDVDTSTEDEDRARAVERLATAQDRLAEAQERLTDAQERGGADADIREGIERLERAQLDAREATLRLAETRESAAERERTAMAEVKSAERDLIEARHAAVDAAVATANAEVELATRLSDLAGTPLLPEDRVRLFRDALIEAANAADSRTRPAILEVLNVLDELTASPKAVKLTAETKAANDALQETKNLVQSIIKDTQAIVIPPGTRPRLPGAMAGGTFVGPGSFIVGEGGREVVTLAPAVRADVTPNRQTEALLGGPVLDPELTAAIRQLASQPRISAPITVPVAGGSDSYSVAAETARQLQSLAVRLSAMGF